MNKIMSPRVLISLGIFFILSRNHRSEPATSEPMSRVELLSFSVSGTSPTAIACKTFPTAVLPARSPIRTGLFFVRREGPA